MFNGANPGVDEQLKYFYDAWALARAAAIAPIEGLELCMGGLLIQGVKTDFDRLTRSPWPAASLASSGISFFRSALAASCS